MMDGVFQIANKVVLGGGVRSRVADEVLGVGARKVLVVTDHGVVKLGAVDELVGILEKARLDVVLFDRVQADPTVANVDEGLGLLRQHGCDVIVAVGGGSPIDAAKAIGVLSVNPGPLAVYAGYHRVPRAGVPVVAVPTTAGTGSEVTKVAVITDSERDVKMMILSGYLLPRVALVDFELTMSMPASLTAAVGVDTLTHGIEAYVSRKAHGLTDPLALSCVQLVGRFLRRAYREPGDREARAGMMLASCQGGMAFANSSVCLVHGMSRPIGAVFHVPHGLSNAVLLPTVTRYSWRSAVERYAQVARVLGCGVGLTDEAAAQSLVDELERLNADLGVPRLRDCRGVEEAKFRQVLGKMASDALASGSPQNNPRVPTAEEIVKLYEEAW